MTIEVTADGCSCIFKMKDGSEKRDFKGDDFETVLLAVTQSVYEKLRQKGILRFATDRINPVLSEHDPFRRVNDWLVMEGDSNKSVSIAFGLSPPQMFVTGGNKQVENLPNLPWRVVFKFDGESREGMGENLIEAIENGLEKVHSA